MGFLAARALRALLLLMTVTLGVAGLAGVARGGESGGAGLEVIRDAEIEDYLRALAAPVFRAAQIEPDAVHLVLVRDAALNAFVAGGMNIFLFTGLLQATETPDQLLGVIAHETGHISGGHLVRGAEALRNASREMILATILGIAAGVASGSGEAAAGAMGGAQDLVQRRLMGFSRAQEASADSAALGFLDRAGVSPEGMLAFMKKLAGQELLPLDRRAEYVRTHPLTTDRVSVIAHHLETSRKKNAALDETFVRRHERMKAKLLGYLQPATALLRSTDKDPRVTVRYGRAIAFYRSSNLPRALALVEGLLKDEPDNPYFLELKAQMLFENGRVEDALAPYRKAASLRPGSALLRQACGHALLESRKPEALDEALGHLTEAARIEGDSPETWRLLASGWGRKAERTGDRNYEGMALYALAEESLARGADEQAGQFAGRAQKILPRGSPLWLRAQDIRMAIDPEGKKGGQAEEKEERHR